ncbi:MAG: putative metal-binding motif-containing protein [Alphaproteobacteria bacterium]|nr:putative metal-binding motif-containing protein [Alphaproteobacteria bacterium]
MKSLPLMSLPLLLAGALLAGCGDKEPEVIDDDGDGVEADLDCDDEDPSAYPGNAEVCDGVDNDCDGLIDNAPTDGITFNVDIDGDGFGVADATEVACAARPGLVENADDCDDASAAIYPGAQEYCDNVDNDCDGETDESDARGALPYWADGDGDGFGDAAAMVTECVQPTGYVTDDTDCDDDDGDIYPGAAETWYDGVDSSCHGRSDYDADDDGYDAEDYGGTDCDDADDEFNPGAAEVWYDGEDQDCADDNDYDADADGEDADDYGGTDCDDDDATINTAAEDTWYDGIDQDCAGDNDYDADYDGYESDAYGGDDCDDTDLAVRPYAWEDEEDGIDNDCDGTVDVSSATDFEFGDDSNDSVTLTNWTFDICGGAYSDIYVDSNGKINLEDVSGNLDYDDYSESTSEFLQNSVNVSVMWDDLNPGVGGGVYYVEYSDALVVYWREVPEYLYPNGTGSNTFSVTLHADGWIQIDYDSVDSLDSIVGWSCATDSSAPEVDISEALWAPVEGSAGLGQGTEAAYYEYFSDTSTDPFDLNGMSVRFCGWSGTDGDGDGWTDECGDPDDSDANVTP